MKTISPNKETTVKVRVSIPILEAIDSEAERTGVSRSEWLRSAINEKLEKRLCGYIRTQEDTVVDLGTMLEWHIHHEEKSFDLALALIKQFNTFDSNNKWRLPTKEELKSLSLPVKTRDAWVLQSEYLPEGHAVSYNLVVKETALRLEGVDAGFLAVRKFRSK